MKDELDDIDLIFRQKLGGFSSSVVDEGWAGIERKVVRKNFFRFSFTTINIYYFSILMAFAGVGSYSTYHVVRNYHKRNQQQIHQTNDSIKQIQLPVDTSPQVELQPEDFSKPELEKADPIHSITKKSIISNPATAIILPIQKTDSGLSTIKPAIPKPDSVQANVTIKKVIKKKVFVKQTHVLVNSDTIK